MTNLSKRNVEIQGWNWSAAGEGKGGEGRRGVTGAARRKGIGENDGEEEEERRGG